MGRGAKLGLWEQLYFPALVDGLKTTVVHMFSKKITEQYPGAGAEAAGELPRRPSAQPRRSGRVKCVACYMCATACPAHCIDIVAAPAPPEWKDREKYPETFVIDELRCIYCGMCEEACPVDAIELTTLYDLTGLSREEMMFDKEKLLSVFEPRRTPAPTRSAPGRAFERGVRGPAAAVVRVPITPINGLFQIERGHWAFRRYTIRIPLVKKCTSPNAIEFTVPDSAFRPDHTGWLLSVIGFLLLLPRPRGRFIPGGIAFLIASIAAFGVWLYSTFGRPMPDASQHSPLHSFLARCSGLRHGPGGSAEPGSRRDRLCLRRPEHLRAVPLLAAPFLMAATIIIYAGAIIVTFLFVLMLSQVEGPSDENDRSREPLMGSLAGFAFTGLVLFGVVYLGDRFGPDRWRGRSETRRQTVSPGPGINRGREKVPSRSCGEARSHSTRCSYLMPLAMPDWITSPRLETA